MARHRWARTIAIFDGLSPQRDDFTRSIVENETRTDKEGHFHSAAFQLEKFQSRLEPVFALLDEAFFLMTAKLEKESILPIKKIKSSGRVPANNWATSGYDKGRKTRQRIVEVGSQLFAKKGYHATSMDEVSSTLGMTKGAVYAHFKRKRELYIACMESSLSFFREVGELDTTVKAEEGLTNYLRWLGERLSKKAIARSFFIQIIREDDDDEMKIELIRDLFSTPYLRLCQLIERLNGRVESRAFAFFVFSTLLLDADLHRYHVLMAGKSSKSHNLNTTIDNLVTAIKHAR